MATGDTGSAPAPLTAPSSLEWIVSDRSVKLNVQPNGKVTVLAPERINSFMRVLLTAIDKTDHTRQAGAMLYLSHTNAPLEEDVAQAELDRDKVLIELVILMGGLGALLGASRSLANFVGNDAFFPRWSLFYIFRPTFGAGLALLVFLGYRIGAVTGVKGSAPADPFAATFVAGMVGLFADTVLQKLKDLVTALFPTQDERKDKVVSSTAPPTVESIEVSLATKRMKIRGNNFLPGATAALNGKTRSTTFVSANELTVTLMETDRAGDVKVVVTNPDAGVSAEFSGKITEVAPAKTP